MAGRYFNLDYTIGSRTKQKNFKKIFFNILMAHLSSGHKVAKIKTKQEFVLGKLTFPTHTQARVDNHSCCCYLLVIRFPSCWCTNKQSHEIVKDTHEKNVHTHLVAANSKHLPLLDLEKMYILHYTGFN